jgi:hypothetical protein
MIFLSTIKDCPSWVYDHPLKSDDDILDLHSKVCQRENDLWVEYHLEMSEMTITTEVKLMLYNQHTKLRRMRQTLIDTLKDEMPKNCFIRTKTEEILYRTDPELMLTHTRLLITNRVSPRLIHIFLIAYKLSIRMDLLEKEIAEYHDKGMSKAIDLYSQVNVLKQVRESIERWIGGSSHGELAALASLHFK